MLMITTRASVSKDQPMQTAVNGTQLWFDVDGPSLVPDGSEMRQRPTVVLVHGGPGVYDHSYFKPEFAVLAEHAQVVYLDLRGHGRSDWGTLPRGASKLVRTTSAYSATRSD
jgi:pimeloyl-ACP methyl ester carboxylesterase